MMPLAAAVWLGSLAAVTGAQGKTGLIPANESLTVTGSLTYAWHGDPARGCAREGLCGVVGAIVFRSDGSTEAFSEGQRVESLDLTGTSTVRVRRTGPGADGSGDCVELSSYSDVTLDFPPSGGLPVQGSPLSSGRCAGPTSQDLERVSVPWKVTGRRLPTIDARGRAPFVAGPFSGELISTILMRPDTSQSSSSGSGGPPTVVVRPPPTPHRLVEFVDLRYNVSNAPGTLLTTFAGTSSPFCDELDSCGVAGSLTASVAPYHGTLRMFAVRLIKHRLSAQRAIADFKAGKLTLLEWLLRPDGLRLRLGEILSRNGAPDCNDALTVGSSPFQRPSLTLMQASRGAVVFELAPSALGPIGVDSGTLRTHCPGPASNDALGPFQFESPPLGQAVIDPGRMLERHIAVALAAAGKHFHGLGYSGSRAGSSGCRCRCRVSAPGAEDWRSRERSVPGIGRHVGRVVCRDSQRCGRAARRYER
jgi:hypothetical protein